MSATDLSSQSTYSGRALSPIVVGIVIFAVTAVLVVIWLFVRGPQYATLYSDLPLEASAAVVKDLESSGTEFRLSGGGTRIEVPEKELDRLRVTFASADGVLNGTDGFELFNQSEMGLTEFTQRIKFQRALQGELARTIMSMDDVREARVHLTMPERNLFRSDRSFGKAAVTIRTESGARPSEAMVSGVQQLLSASVPDLAPENVVVLNSRAEAVSFGVPILPIENAATGFGQVSNELAGQMQKEIVRIAPNLKHELRAETPQIAGSTNLQKINLKVNARLRSSGDLSPEQRTHSTVAVNQLALAAGFAGAELLFVSVPPQNFVLPLPDEIPPNTSPTIASTMQRPLTPSRPETILDWILTPSGKGLSIGILGVLIVGLFALIFWQRTKSAKALMEKEEDLEAIRELRQALARQSSGSFGVAQSSAGSGREHAK